MDFRVLGQLEVYVGERQLAIPAGQLRTLLAALLVRGGQVVPVDQLAEALWGADAVAATATIRSYVRRLRAALAAGEPDRVLVRAQSPGYVLDVEPGEVDLSRFREKVRRAAGATQPSHVAELLTAALAEWHGPALSDVRSELLHRQVVPRLIDERLAAVDRWAAARLALGQAGDVIGDLLAFADAHPMHESLQAHLITALYQAGRQAEALRHYDKVRRALADQLGVNPSNQLEAAYLAILRSEPTPAPTDDVPRTSPTTSTATNPADPGSGSTEAPEAEPAKVSPSRPVWPVAVPAQLPGGISAFTGREREVARLCASATDAAAPPVTVVAGPPGVGKTALAVHAAHRLRAHFPDGQLFIDLRGYGDQPPREPAKVLRWFLRALGTPDPAIPYELADRAATYRSLLADRRVLVVLDNAGSVEQIRPLIPGGVGCRMIVTSRRRYDGLAATAEAEHLAVDVLTDEESASLVANAVGADRVDAEPAEVDRLIGLCGRLPLALSVAAARLAEHPRRPVSWLVEELADDRLAGLTIDGDAAVPAALASTYRALPPDAARLFRLLGLHPGADIATPVIAAIAAEPTESAEPTVPTEPAETIDSTEAATPPDPGLSTVDNAVATLVASHLIAETAPGRYGMHDLVRLYARQCAENDEPAEARKTAVARILDCYLDYTDRASRPFLPYTTLPPPRRIEFPPPEPTPFTVREDSAMEWIATEYANILAANRLAAETGEHDRCWQLADAMWIFQQRRRLYDDWIETHERGFAASRELGDSAAEAWMLRRLGTALAEVHHFERALDCYRQALTITENNGDDVATCQVLNNIGVLMSIWQKPHEARRYLTDSLARARKGGFLSQEAVCLGNLSECDIDLGDAAAAVEHAEAALAIHRGLSTSHHIVPALINLGHARRMLGDLPAALASFTEVIDIDRTRPVARHWLAETYDGMGETLWMRDDSSTDNSPEPIEYFNRALRLYTELAHPRAAGVQAKIDRITSTEPT